MNSLGNNEKILKILEEHYRVIKEQKNAWDFFLNTAEYVRFIQNNSTLSNIIKKVECDRKNAYEIFNKIDNKAIKELQNAAKTVTENIKKLNINIDPINNVVKELQAYNDGHILSSVSRAHKLDSYLFEIARNLKASGLENIIQKFVDDHKNRNNIYGNFTFSRTLSLSDEAEKELEMKKDTQIWGAWENLPFIERIFFDEVNLTKELKEAVNSKDRMAKWTLMNYIGVRTELGTMQAHRKSDSELVFFKVSDFKNKLDRIHKYLITELLSEEKISEKNLENSDIKPVKNNIQPIIFEEKGNGYFKFYKQGLKIKIGGIKTRKFMLLKALSDPLGVAKTIEVVFENITIPKDKNDSTLNDIYLSLEKQRNLIEYTIKELQKIKELKGKVKLEFINNRKSVRLIVNT